jgi:hypothetical protein
LNHGVFNYRSKFMVDFFVHYHYLFIADTNIVK